MARKDKPYRVYRTSRAARRSPAPEKALASREGSPKASVTVREDGAARPAPWDPLGGEPWAEPPEPYELPPRERPRPRHRTARRIAFWSGLVVLIAILFFGGWGTWGYFAFRSGVQEANERLPEGTVAALSPPSGSILSTPTNLLLLGVDAGPTRAGDTGRADAIVLVRTDPDEHRMAFLSIPRDLRVEIPGRGFDKVNAAYAFGGPALTVETVENLTGLPVNHVVVVDFASFPDVIDELGGVTIDVPKPIVSNRFECPFGSRAECERWKGWRFAKGEQEMDGRRALIYSRIRENQLDPNESDLTRGGRQQQVVQAVADAVVSFGGFLRLPFIGDDLVRPLATDLSATEILELGWVKFRAAEDSTLRCNLGGVATEIEGVFYLVGSEENVSVVSMVTGDSAPQPPPPGQGPFAPGCRVGR